MISLEDRIVLADAIASLSSPERTIIFGIYDLRMKQVDIAARIGYSTRHVRRLHRNALHALQRTLAD